MLDLGFDIQSIRKMELACEEALVNIIEHGRSPGDITVELKPSEVDVEIAIRDHGFAFNPLEHEIRFDGDLPVEEMEIGGHGIRFMRQYADEIRYERIDDVNTLFLTKRKVL